MRAVICRELTGVSGLEFVSDWPEPQAGPGEVVVEVVPGGFVVILPLPRVAEQQQRDAREAAASVDSDG